MRFHARITYRVEPQVFDRALQRRTQSILFRIGKYGLKTMRSSIKRTRSKRRYKPKPGRPPQAHVAGGGGLKAIRFDVMQNGTVGRVIFGPIRTPKKAVIRTKVSTTVITSKKPVPQLLNETGAAQYDIVYHRSGIRKEETVIYRKFPISDYDPTIQAVDRKLREFLLG